jgi:hypothetical protein
MSGESQKPGLGKVIYSVNEQNEEQGETNPSEVRVEQTEVQEADEESFPASDPPSFAGGNVSQST